jgi:hypothetical protein
MFNVDIYKCLIIMVDNVTDKKNESLQLPLFFYKDIIDIENKLLIGCNTDEIIKLGNLYKVFKSNKDRNRLFHFTIRGLKRILSK